MEELRRVSIEPYGHAAAHAEARGIILPDTKFEFGASHGTEVVLGDEVFTPDSSRFWPAGEYEPGRPQRSFDKQYLRDWLDEIGWDHSPPAPELPEEVVTNTRASYLEAYERITGRTHELPATGLPRSRGRAAACRRCSPTPPDPRLTLGPPPPRPGSSSGGGRPARAGECVPPR